MAKIEDEDDALAILAWLRDFINDAYARREEITPCYEHRRMVGFLDVYHLLPATDCKACGEATCTAFAVGLVEGRHSLADCSGLDAAHRERLASLLGAYLTQ
jgi:ArsR family metal-binding transcriptional regulator